MMRTVKILLAALAATAISAPAVAAPKGDKSTLERGRYIVSTSGCNDCHTAGYPESGGKVAEAKWLTGSPVGFSGPWGTTYPANLRLTAQSMPEAAWIARARSEMRPPMPWFSLRDMNDADLRAVYRYIRSLGPAGDSAPAYVAPGGKIATPYIDFVPKNLPLKTAAK
ncbi:MAG: c-type cytochrome [Burkholderiales bacterium]|nr:c-type cytochrome [Burkholderiales bacterium]